jgi:hypothetical protein
MNKSIVVIIKALFGPLILIILAWLAYVTIKGEVTEANSLGLVRLEDALIALAAAWAYWAYRKNGSGATSPEPQKAPAPAPTAKP